MDIIRRIDLIKKSNPRLSEKEQQKLTQIKAEANSQIYRSAIVSLFLGTLIGITGKHKSIRRRFLESSAIGLGGIILGSIYSANQYLAKSYIIYELHQEPQEQIGTQNKQI